ncbi:MAG: hypothetical protein A2268_01445 [Candidatus Raymondbacteria bacterium RifOxyA12_full_50_37]|uniref:DUF202 domain-containing protein n=1 Tax=Candidatus Raymondbacteria bacterium RIFOXYD12_FULL_49_13 TaxID=1817890 RepID=A0A1F7FA62_UNCRA|nr:MAG: hypothetical protein A2268_01445 [Candidatus Raymondbacteria bacterium RifOxyA12_full_50_37]OGJ87945.1 MAG: hypothetical protein A2248_01890 [Candidatus Raymondbacteria bacterium RIFOXYA2_FULL_49_16]OGJ95628.1 MAG: hypothetical protein A2453_13140 [Candidatus Raymondbacteria bacterium RIFOXYC2_FULL_50_21]OGJ97646.1 MAG: hypothetical protein A2487_13010 [Candidatus Raymondbacteria bacterium RifOxyC12_full_50_8]OGK03402.1 MAG: hypothetical protein A2519_15415 [Candidatus Raymondbacteria b
MKYKRFHADKMILRDHLAYDRTVLANERTLLSYLRTAIMLLATGATAIKLFQPDHAIFIAGCALSIGAVVIGLFGVRRFLGVRQSLARLYSKQLDAIGEGPSDNI